MATPDLNGIASRLMAAMHPVKIVDEKAETAEEIAMHSGRSYSHTRALILHQVKAGKLEQVWKRGRIRLIPAYRATRK